MLESNLGLFQAWRENLEKFWNAALWVEIREAEAEAEAVPWVSRFRIRGWVSY